MRYAVVIEQSPTGFGAYVPDLPGCVAVAESADEVQELIRDAVLFHLDALREDGIAIPAGGTRVGYVEVADGT